MQPPLWWRLPARWKFSAFAEEFRAPTMQTWVPLLGKPRARVVWVVFEASHIRMVGLVAKWSAAVWLPTKKDVDPQIRSSVCGGVGSPW